MAYRHIDHSSAGIYGCWIGPDNVVHPDCPLPVAPFPFGDMPMGGGESGETPYGEGYVMARFQRDSTLCLSGRLPDLYRSRGQWLALASAVSRIEVVQIYDEAELGRPVISEAVVFQYPQQETALEAYLKSGDVPLGN